MTQATLNVRAADSLPGLASAGDGLEAKLSLEPAVRRRAATVGLLTAAVLLVLAGLTGLLLASAFFGYGALS